MDRYLATLTEEDLRVLRNMIDAELESRKDEDDEYIKVLRKLFIKGMINEQQLEQKIQEHRK